MLEATGIQGASVSLIWSSSAWTDLVTPMQFAMSVDSIVSHSQQQDSSQQNVSRKGSQRCYILINFVKIVCLVR